MRQVFGELAAWLNLRSLCVFITLVLLASPLSVSWMIQPNAFLFWLGAHLTPKSEPPNDLVKVLVSREEMDRMIKDVSGAMGMANLLQGLRGVYTKGVLLVVDEQPNTENYAADVLMPRLLNETTVKESLQNTGLLADVEALTQRRDRFYAQLQDGSLILGVVQVTDPTLLIPNRKAAGWSGYPVLAAHHQMAYPLLWKTGEEDIPDAVLALLQKTQGSQHFTRREHSLLLDDKPWPISSGDVIYPMYSSVGGLSDSIPVVALADLKNAADFNRFYNKTVIIGVAGDTGFSDIAAAFYSVESHGYYTVPDWYPWLEKIALPLLLCYLFLLLPRLTVNLGLALTTVLAVALLGLQFSLQFSTMQWLPVGLLLVYLVVGQLCILLWIQQKKYLPGADDVAALYTVHDVMATKVPVLLQRREEPRMPDSGFARTVADRSRKFSLGRYEIDSELGRGAMGVVYLGHDPSIDRKVAIKTLNYEQFPPENLKEVKERFFREARAAGNMKHQNIVTIYEMAETEDRAYIAMEYVGGKPLSAYTKKGQLLPVDEVYWIMVHVAEALGYAHEHNIVHRDIKPSNILYDREREEVKVADFGIARIIDHASTRTGDIFGSPLYMSPEQIKGEKVSGASDIFSLGVTFYQLLTGELPFTGDTMAAITHQIVNGKYLSVTEINPELPDSAQRMIAKALQKNPEKRFASAYEVSDLLQKYLGKG